ncbi:hypothetical protein LSAT2_007676 [Lamellibrachia satsuma]|nr:hypothetical protein LSAT2_007676 [Lamellibrachia satsuma]
MHRCPLDCTLPIRAGTIQRCTGVSRYTPHGEVHDTQHLYRGTLRYAIATRDASYLLSTAGQWKKGRFAEFEIAVLSPGAAATTAGRRCLLIWQHNRWTWKRREDSGGFVNELSSRNNCSAAEFFPEKSTWRWNEQVCRSEVSSILNGHTGWSGAIPDVVRSLFWTLNPEDHTPAEVSTVSLGSTTSRLVLSVVQPCLRADAAHEKFIARYHSGHMTDHVASTPSAWAGYKKGRAGGAGESGRQQRQQRLLKMKDLMMSTTVDSLFVDDSFPPDKSSLTYVYSGDDQYERMIFRRPPRGRPVRTHDLPSTTGKTPSGDDQYERMIFRRPPVRCLARRLHANSDLKTQVVVKATGTCRQPVQLISARRKRRNQQSRVLACIGQDDTSPNSVDNPCNRPARGESQQEESKLSGPQLYGIGGVCNIDLSWEQWTAGHWFRCALAVISTDRRYMERLIPNYGHFGQDFGRSYAGSFRFRLWRFGEWNDVLVDDFLPVLNGCLAYCPPLGSSPEFWGPLVEKAYAKCHKAYEAIESGNCLNAIADLSGAICEHYNTSSSGTIPLYHVIYKSCANRSLIVCWRNSRSFRQGEFKSQRRMYAPSGGSLDRQVSMPGKGMKEGVWSTERTRPCRIAKETSYRQGR